MIGSRDHELLMSFLTLQQAVESEVTFEIFTLGWYGATSGFIYNRLIASLLYGGRYVGNINESGSFFRLNFCFKN